MIVDVAFFMNFLLNSSLSDVKISNNIGITCKSFSSSHCHKMSFKFVEFEGHFFFISLLFLLLAAEPIGYAKNPSRYQHHPLE